MKSLLAISILSLFGCNSIFYHPDREHYAKLSKDEPAPKEVFVEGSSSLHTWLFETKGKKLGTVLHFHGNAQNLSAHFKFSSWLAQYGYSVLIFDYRGYGKSPGSPSREGLVEDGTSLLRYTFTQFPDEDVYILAQSLGGAVAVPVLAGSPEFVPKAVVLESTFSSYREVARDKLGRFFLTWPFQWPLSFLVSDNLSPRDYIGSLRHPILFIHGTKDEVVPYDSGKALFDSAKGAEKILWELQGAGHTPAFLNPASPFRNKLVSYFCLHGRFQKTCDKKSWYSPPN